MKVYTVLLCEVVDDYPSVVGCWQYAGKTGHKRAERRFKSMVKKMMGIYDNDEMDMADEEEIETAWMMGEYQDYDSETGHRTLWYTKQHLFGSQTKK